MAAPIPLPAPVTNAVRPANWAAYCCKGATRVDRDPSNSGTLVGAARTSVSIGAVPFSCKSDEETTCRNADRRPTDGSLSRSRIEGDAPGDPAGGSELPHPTANL